MPSGRPTSCRCACIGIAGILVAVAGCQDGSESLASLQEPTPPAVGVGAAAAPLAFRQMSAGGYHTCGVTADNGAYCWGENFGQLGDGTTTRRQTPVAVTGGLRFVQVSAGLTHTCGLTTDNRAYCWGNEQSGRLGDGSTVPGPTAVPLPVAVVGGRSFRRIDAGYAHTCGVTVGYVAFCWGDNHGGQLGDSTTTERVVPVRVRAGTLRFLRVTAGEFHTCGVTRENRAYCWGDNTSGQLGDGTTTRHTTPVAVKGRLSWLTVVAAGYQTCGLSTDKRAYCWGNDGNGQSGIGAIYQRRKVPQLVVGGLQFQGVSPGGNHVCGVTLGNKAYCWGLNFAGQLGNGTTTTSTTAVAVSGGLQFGGGVTAGSGGHSCGWTAAGQAYCWGRNESGALGDGTLQARAIPAPVAGLQ
jgi:alpha-tubulin suppressor-like RCC1 family protein